MEEKKMKKQFMLFFLSFFVALVFSRSICLASSDFQLVPKTTKSGSSEGYYSKIPLAPLPVQKGKLNFFKQSGWDYVSFQGDYDEKTGKLKGVFTGATANNSPNSGGSYYCEFTASVKEGDKSAIFKYYPTHGTAETLEHCYSQVVFNFEKNQKAGKEDWWPDDVTFEIKPLDSDRLEDSGARFSDIYGEVDILLPTGYDEKGEPIFDDEEGWNYAKLDMELPYGAKLRLKERSGIILAIPGSEPYELKTPENVYPNGETIIILPTKQKKDSLFRLMTGQLYNNVKKIIKDNTMDIEMGQAVAGIKGTTFVLEEDGVTSRLLVLDGKVSFTSKKTGETVLVEAGEKISANGQELGKKDTFDTSVEMNKWENIKPFKAKSDFVNQKIIVIFASVLVVFIAIIVLFIIKKIKHKA